MSLIIEHRRNSTTANTNRRESEQIWSDCPWDDLVNPKSQVNGAWLFDDFTDFGLPGTQTTQINLGRYKVYAKAGGAFTTDSMPTSATANVFGGVISVTGDGDGDNGAIATEACPFLLTTTQNSKLWFEARVATTSILTNMGQWFVGLMANNIGSGGSAYTFTDGLPLANANALASASVAVGFNRLEDGLGVLNTSYADGAAAWTDVQAAANSTLAANTWIKLGMKVDFADATRCVRFYVDGVECSTAMTKAALLALTYLDVRGLGPCMAFYLDSAGAADYFYLDWWRVAQVVN